MNEENGPTLTTLQWVASLNQRQLALLKKLLVLVEALDKLKVPPDVMIAAMKPVADHLKAANDE